MDRYDPVPDAAEWLDRHAPAERHAVARLLDVDGDALAVLRGLIERPDCDRATAAMIFWRVRGLVPSGDNADLAPRRALLDAVAALTREGRFRDAAIAWDGAETWEGVTLIGAAPFDPALAVEVPEGFSGPFGTVQPEPKGHGFFDSDYGDDDIFDSLWRARPDHVAMADWLIGKPAAVWMAAVEDLRSGHNEAIYEWMLRRPECPDSVAGRIFWTSDPGFLAQTLIARRDWRSEATDAPRLAAQRWRAGDLVPSGLDFRGDADPASYRAAIAGHPDPLDVPAGLLDPAPGETPPPVTLDADFDYWCARTSLSGLVPRPRAAAVADWRGTLADRAASQARRDEEAARRAMPAGPIETLIYGGKFTGDRSQLDRAWRGLWLVTLAAVALVIGLWRTGAPLAIGFWTFLAAVAAVSVYLSSVQIGRGRMWRYGAGMTFATMAGAFLFRWIDKGLIG